MKTLKELFLEELADMYDAEHRIGQALPQFTRVATCTHLQDILHSHLAETDSHAARLESVFASFGLAPRTKKCHATIGLIDEAERIAAHNKGEPTVNAALIFALQKIEHYEIASYGTLREWAQLLGHDAAADILQGILDEEFAANQALTDLARAHVNEEPLVSEVSGSGSGGLPLPFSRGIRPVKTGWETTSS